MPLYFETFNMDSNITRPIGFTRLYIVFLMFNSRCHFIDIYHIRNIWHILQPSTIYDCKREKYSFILLTRGRLDFLWNNLIKHIWHNYEADKITFVNHWIVIIDILLQMILIMLIMILSVQYVDNTILLILKNVVVFCHNVIIETISSM